MVRNANRAGQQPDPLTELLLDIWVEQHENTRRYLVEGLKRGETRERYRAQGIHLMLLNLKDILIALPAFESARQQVEADYGCFR